jgi:hypothetical protein
MKPTGQETKKKVMHCLRFPFPWGMTDPGLSSLRWWKEGKENVALWFAVEIKWIRKRLSGRQTVIRPMATTTSLAANSSSKTIPFQKANATKHTNGHALKRNWQTNFLGKKF